MATLGVKWRQTEEHARAEARAFMYNESLTLPVDEFMFFKRFILKRIGNMVRIYTHKPMLNNAMIRFLWVFYNRLDPVQRNAIEHEDSKNVIQAWRENVTPHITELEYMSKKHHWLDYYSTTRYLEYVRGITNLTGVELVDNSVLTAIFEEFSKDPRRAYCNTEAIQWTGSNKRDIEKYYDYNFDLVVCNDTLTINTCNGPLHMALGDWTWPDTADGIDGGDYLYLMKRKMETGQPGIWIKPGSSVRVPSRV